MSDAQSPIAADHQMKTEWEEYKKTGRFANGKHWALTIQPMIQEYDPEAQRKRYSLMPLEQRETHIEGSLWDAFCAGYEAASR